MKNRLAVLFACLIISYSGYFFFIGALASESTESAESTASETENNSTESEGTKSDDSDKTELTEEELKKKQEEEEREKKNQMIKELEESIKEKEGQISQAEKDKKELQSNLTDVKKLVTSLESQKNDLNNYVTSLDAELANIEEKIENSERLIEAKEIEIAQASADLEEATRVQDEQYASMKMRIKYMYERSDTYILDMMLNAKSFGDMVNRADYIEKLSQYDQEKLQEYIANRNYIDSCKSVLEAEEAVLEAAKAQIEEEKANLEELISVKQHEIEVKENDITNKEEAIRQYEADLAEQTEILKNLEAAVAAQKKKLAEENGTIISYDGGKFKFPAPSFTQETSPFGWRMHPILGVNQFHNGVDLAAPGGSPILAAYDGEVVAATYSATMGNYIMIDHGDGLYTIYMHASALYVSEGATVSRGQKIAAVGTTGRSTGNHLHFSVRLNGEYVNPWNYISK